MTGTAKAVWDSFLPRRAAAASMPPPWLLVNAARGWRRRERAVFPGAPDGGYRAGAQSWRRRSAVRRRGGACGGPPVPRPEVRYPQRGADAGDRTEWQLPARAGIVCQQFKKNKRTEQRTLNLRVWGSSPWRRTRTDLGFYHSRSLPCVRFVSMFAQCLGLSGTVTLCIEWTSLLDPEVVNGGRADCG